MPKICSRLSSELSVMVEIGMLLPKPGFMELCAHHLLVVWEQGGDHVWD
jgi:hypothetical protein